MLKGQCQGHSDLDDLYFIEEPRYSVGHMSLLNINRKSYMGTAWHSCVWFVINTRQSVAVQREGGIPVGKKILHPYQNP